MGRVLKIPQTDNESFVELVHLKDQEWISLVENIYKTSTDSPITSLKDSLGEYNRFSKILGGLFFAYVSLNEHSKKFLQSLYNTYKSFDTSTSIIPFEDFETRFNQLLNYKNPVLKKINAQFNSNQVSQAYADARIITDIRPVFNLDENRTPIGSILIYQLRFNYEENGERKNIYLSLDKEDLEELKQEIENTLLSTTKLQSQLNNLDFLKPID